MNQIQHKGVMQMADTAEEQMYNIAREECMLSIKLLMDALDHMEDILKVAKMKHAPIYTKQLLAAEWEAVSKAHRGMKEHESKYSAGSSTDEATLLFAEVVEKNYEKMREDYENFLKHSLLK